MTTFLWTAFALGLFGSLHCLGMCGPIALALPAGSGARGRYAAGRLLYNAGRTVTYGFLGIAAGVIGQTISLVGAQRWLSIGAGVLILLACILGPVLAKRTTLNRLWLVPVQSLQSRLSHLLRRHGLSTLFGIGLLNGLLPCGLVYVAMAGAAAMADPVNGFFYMILFGLGTTPLMLAVSLGSRLLQHTVRLRLQRAIPVAAAVVGVLFILRGSALGIPYLSPADPAHGSCCHSPGP